MSSLWAPTGQQRLIEIAQQALTNLAQQAYTAGTDKNSYRLEEELLPFIQVNHEQDIRNFPNWRTDMANVMASSPSVFGKVTKGNVA